MRTWCHSVSTHGPQHQVGGWGGVGVVVVWWWGGGIACYEFGIDGSSPHHVWLIVFGVLVGIELECAGDSGKLGEWGDCIEGVPPGLN